MHDITFPMTHEVQCTMYYSLSGEPFDVHGRGAADIEHTAALLHIYTRDEVELPNITRVQPLPEPVTELSVALPVKKGRFFNSETYCLFLNNKGEVLEVKQQQSFPVRMMRDARDKERLHVKFKIPYLHGRHQWQPVASLP